MQTNSQFIFLYGPPGSGKSTVGKQLAQDLGLSFFDLDDDIEYRSRMTIPEIFEQEGEAGFRQRERYCLDAILDGSPAVVALGGGALLDDSTRQRVEAAGQVACLTASFDALLARLQSSPVRRPLLKGDAAGQLDRLLQRRSAHYASFPLQVNTGGISPAQATWQTQLCLGRFRVSGMGADYDVLVQPGGLDQLGRRLLERNLQGPIVVVSDQNVAGLHGQRAVKTLEEAGYAAHLVTISPGETYKTIETVISLWTAFLDHGLERSSTVVALGGGVVGDLTGFAAATYLRGISWVGVPSTLLAMVDSSLGGKTGADLPQGKNLIGAFHPPSLVLADPDLLTTLPPAELRSGLAEVVKHGVIGDPELFELCSAGWEAVQADWEPVVRRGMAVKIQVIQADPFEKGWRAALNLGHTLGHAVELASHYDLRHGEAVSIGMVAAARLAELRGLAETGLVGQIESVLGRLGLPIKMPSYLEHTDILRGMSLDKKRRDGKVRFVLPIRIGEVRVGVEVEDLEEVIRLSEGKR
ncbi:MAG TPA: 3-dehydroquinate synthase [Anaerolineales bacterium]